MKKVWLTIAAHSGKHIVMLAEQEMGIITHVRFEAIYGGGTAMCQTLSGKQQTFSYIEPVLLERVKWEILLWVREEKDENRVKR